MALINCNECNHQVSSEASKCPSCGIALVPVSVEKVRKGCAKGCLWVFIGFSALIVLAAIFGGDAAPKSPSEVGTNSFYDGLDSKREAVVKRFQSRLEPISKDATWTAKNIFKVGVIDDGTNRNRYAQYVLETLYDYGFKGKKIWVQVIDIQKLSSNGRWVKLGEAWGE